MTSLDEEFARQQEIVREARQFAQQAIQPRAREFDERGEFGQDLIRALQKRGYLLAALPRQYGGLELSPVQYGLFTEALGKACCSTRALLTVQCSLVGQTLLDWASEQQKKYWLSAMATDGKLGAFALTEPDVGSDARHLHTTYEKQGNAYVLKGQKRWISFGAIADFFLVAAVNDNGLTFFVVERDRPGLQVNRMTGLLAARGAHLAELELKNVTIPGDNVVGRVGAGHPFILNSALDHGRYSVAWGGVAIAQACVEAMVSYARSRSQFGKKLAEFQLVQRMIGEAVTKTHAARALCIKAGELRQSHSTEAVIETTIAKHFASQAAMEIATDAVQVHGGNGCSSDYPVERLFREAKILEIIEGTVQIQQQMIARYGLANYHSRASL